MTDDFAQAYEDRFSASVMFDTPPVLQIPSMDTPPDPAQPKAPVVTEKQLLLDPKFAASARDIHLLFEGEPFDGDDQMAARYGIDAIGEFNYNFAGPAGLPGESGISSPGAIGQAAALLTSGSQDQAKSFVYLMDRYDQLPNFTLAGTGRMIRGMVADPSVYTGFGTLALGFAARKTGAVGIKKALVEIAKRPGTSAAVYTGVEAGAADQLTQAVEERAGYEIDPATGALRTAITSVVGGAAGGGLVKGGEMLAREFGPAIGEAISQAGQSAEARMAERGPITDRVMSGADPMEVIDPALAVAGKLARPTKENPVTAVPPTETQPGIIAFHGSGADFDQFSLEKIGTGEGAQAYGYGLYFTDSEDIAKFYKDAVLAMNDLGGNIDVKYKGKQIDMSLTNLKEASSNPENTAIIKLVAMMSQPRYQTFKELAKKTVTKNLQEEIDKFSSVDMEETLGKDVAIAYTKKLQDQLDAVSNINVNDIDVKRQTGKMYKVGLAPNPDDMLNYQTTFADQPKNVQDALKAIGYEVEKNLVGQKKPKTQIDLAMRRPMPMILDSLKGRITEDIRAGKQQPDRADKILSEKLLEQGVPGVKYRAAGSRGASIDAADVKMNYVIFDDKAIKILEKYGIVGPVAIMALGAAKQENNNDSTQSEAM